MAFETYQLVLLRRDERWQDDPARDLSALQKAHLAHLTRMAEEGHMVAAGPFGDQDDETLRGLCLYRVGSVDEARALAEADPMVQAGRLRVEVMTWSTEAGYVVFPKAPPRVPQKP
ncbi:MAG TPA: YciI family protein [Myxococcaceae bacterium]|nr:YciI family protein [Myxococcaceae bacterium]